MKSPHARLLAGEAGQMFPVLALIGALLLTLGGICVDLGHAFVCKRELQASADAAALAGAFALSGSSATVASVQAEASKFSSATGSNNANPAFTSVGITTTPVCLSTVSGWGVLCSSSTIGDNAVQVLETATTNTWFIRLASIFGVQAAQFLTIKAESTAAMRGASNAQYNVAVLIDTTASMGSSDTDANCGNTRIYCALQGVQTLLQELSPCAPSSTSSNCVAFDQVSLFTFPNIQANNASDDTTCPTSNPTIPGLLHSRRRRRLVHTHGSSPTYQVTSYPPTTARTASRMAA